MKHPNPRQGITIGSTTRNRSKRRAGLCVKHPNPRQGITISPTRRTAPPASCTSVKHPNPRQGITIAASADPDRRRRVECETPKSPPGDYNSMTPASRLTGPFRSVKHPNPRQGITILLRSRRSTRCFLSVKHPNPRQGITIKFDNLPVHELVSKHRVKHPNPRQGITMKVDDVAPAQAGVEV